MESGMQEAAVKILKARKRITAAQLQTELIEMLKQHFKPSPRLIKEQFEWLLDNNFMKRDEDDNNTFVYVA